MGKLQIYDIHITGDSKWVDVHAMCWCMQLGMYVFVWDVHDAGVYCLEIKHWVHTCIGVTLHTKTKIKPYCVSMTAIQLKTVLMHVDECMCGVPLAQSTAGLWSSLLRPEWPVSSGARPLVSLTALASPALPDAASPAASFQIHHHSWLHRDVRSIRNVMGTLTWWSTRWPRWHESFKLQSR